MKPLLFTTLLLLSACRDKTPTPSVAPTGTPVTTVTSDAGVGSGSNLAGSNQAQAGSAEAVPVERVVRTPEEQERINKAAKAAAKDLEIKRQLKTPEPPRGPAPEPSAP